MPAVSVRLEPVDAQSASKQRRHDLRLYVPGYVDATRSHLNRVLISPPTGDNMRRECEKRCKANNRRGLQKNAGVGIRGIITFSADAVLPDDPAVMDSHFLATAEAIADHLGTTLAGLVVHMDESRPHAHFMLHNYGLNGLSAGRKLDAKTLRGVQDLAGQCWADLGLTRGKPKAQRIKDGDPLHTIIHRDLKRLHEDLPKELSALNERIEKMRGFVKKKPLPKPRTVEVVEERGLIRTKTRRIKVVPLEDAQRWYSSALADITEREKAVEAKMKAADTKLAMADTEYKNARDILNRAVSLSQRMKQEYHDEVNALREKMPAPADKPSVKERQRVRG